MVAVLDCQRCHALTSYSRIRYFCGRPVCDHCGAENPETRLHSVQTHDVFVSFTTGEQCFAQAMDLDLHHPLASRVQLASPETLRRLIAYLGAMPEGMNEFDRSLKSYGKG